MIPTIDLTDLQKNGKRIIGSTGMNGESNIEGNYLIDINININLNDKEINPETLKQLESLLDKIFNLKERK